MAEGAAIASLVGTVAQMSANSKAAKAEQKALEARARAKNEQADELLRRNEFNIKELKIDAKTFMSEQVATFAKSGVALGTGASLTALEDTQDRMFKQVVIDTRESEYNAALLRKGGDIDIQAGKTARKVAESRNTATFLSGAAQVGSAFV